ncbi:hypothetical protein LRH25_26275 [Ideonella azotifigens]|uniref:Uncharacterized protein n=1 Tax=Ideonella azotifigens TaxID=513160 RepID=A0ABN1K2G5_9BURK|nr:hypothetical protein [Ideonella azotifigens]MCD2343835.1 hypothetical protein [Ideonella azotifigens]
MPLPTRQRILKAMCPSAWDTANRVLYDLCTAHPAHLHSSGILAKVLFIGRVYAAAIERRRNKNDDHDNDRFYIDTVAPSILKSCIDDWIHKARVATPATPDGLKTMVQVHGLVTSLFGEISDLEKRSLASKYLHFHVPRLFYIYDSRSVKAIREFSDVLPRASRSKGCGDNEYRKFAEKATSLVKHCESEYGLAMSPRQLDNLLLKINE